MKLTDETKQQIVNELFRDLQEMSNKANNLRPPYQYSNQYETISQMSYISAQIRLKLYLLGAAISSEEIGN